MLERCKEKVEPYLGGAQDMRCDDLPAGGERDGWRQILPGREETPMIILVNQACRCGMAAIFSVFWP